MFVRFNRDRDGRRTRSSSASATVQRNGSIYLNGAAVALLGDEVTHVHLAVDQDDQAIALLPATPSTKSYALTRPKRGHHALAHARLLVREHAVSGGRYRVERVTTLGLTGIAFHYIRTDRTGRPPSKGTTP